MKIIYKKEKENKMDAPCKIQGSIHVLAVIVIQCVQDSGYISVCFQLLFIIVRKSLDRYYEDFLSLVYIIRDDYCIVRIILKSIFPTFASTNTNGISYFIDEDFAIAIYTSVDFFDNLVNDLFVGFIRYNRFNLYFRQQVAAEVNAVVYLLMSFLASVTHYISNHKPVSVVIVKNLSLIHI